MRAFLLAGGLGERLRPLTNRIPKCLVPINGVPLLGIWLHFCARHNLDAVLVNVSRQADLVESFVQRGRWGVEVHVIRESKPIGTAGTVLANRDFVRGDASFGVFHADNLTDFALDKLVAFHSRHDGLLTMGLFRTPTPSEAGVVETTADGRILSFVEKPAVPGSDLANAGVYIARQGLFDAIPADCGVADFGRDVFPGLTGRMFGQVVDGYLKDVGTPSALARARQDWAARAAEASSVTAEPWGAL